MNWEELVSIYGVALTLYKHGKSYSECAEICGCTEQDIKQLFKKYGTGKRELAQEQKFRAIELLNDNYTVKEVADQIGLSEGWVTKVARENGISPMTEVKREREKLVNIVRQYKDKGMSAPEVAELLGVNVHFVEKYCKGINPQISHSYSKQLKKAIAQIEQYGFEYVSGYTDADSFVFIRCPKCGTVFERSMVTIRHTRTKTIICPGCDAIEKENRQKEKDYRKRVAEEERIRKAEEKARAAEEKEKAKLHECPVCGKLTNRKIYCSKDCANKINNKNHELKRDRKIKGVMVDKDITLQKLYERDRGICYLCGEVCDWDDKEERGGVIICGNLYPSIDHVIPLSRGGDHSWQNVKLAHRICNTRKGTKHQKIASLLTTSE